MTLERDIGDFCAWCAATQPAVTLANVRDHVEGTSQSVPLVGGREVTYVNLDNAATTPPFSCVLDCLSRFFEWYASVHRGSGFKSLLSTHVYEHCRNAVARFVGADPDHHTVIFTQNATHALNKLAMRLSVPADHVILSGVMEHHSNLLPWRRVGCRVEYVKVRPEDGKLDLSDLARCLNRNAGRVALVAVSGASNVTGIIPPIRQIARLAHACGAMMAVDATQLVPHRAFRMGAPDDPERVDFAAFSGHKMYAPFGSGVLVGPRAVFEQGAPDMVGGGTVDAVTMDDVVWTAPPEREEAGTPNVPGAVALAASIQALTSIGIDHLAEHERDLTRRLLAKLSRIEGLKLYGPDDLDLREDRLGVIPFNAVGMGHAQLAAVLGYEWGIGVRNGCFCAQPYVRELLGVSEHEMRAVMERLAAGDHATVPGMVRASIGVYNTAEEIDYLVEALTCVLRDGPRARYVLDPQHMDYVPDIADVPSFRPHQYTTA